jgi:hypothetical protein
LVLMDDVKFGGGMIGADEVNFGGASEIWQ